MATTPPPLETLSVISTRVINGLPPLESLRTPPVTVALTSIPVVAPRRLRPRPVVMEVETSSPVPSSIPVTADISPAASIAPAVSIGSSISPVLSSGSRVSPEQIAESRESSTIQIVPSVETIVLGTVPKSSIIPQYPAGLELKLEMFGTYKGRKVPSADVLSRKKNCYIVPWCGKFYYFKILEVVERSPSLLEFKNKPPTKKEGFIVHDKEMYYVTLDDLQRGIIRKSRKVNVKTGATYSDLLAPIGATQVKSPPAKPKARTKKVKAVVATENKYDEGLSRDFGVEILKEVDLAFQDQERALHNFILEEEGEDWSIEETA